MQYLLLFYADEQWRESLSDDERAAITREFYALHDELQESGGYVTGAPLRSTESATTVRVRDEELIVTDGPFAETKEQLGGFFLIEARDLDEACEVASRFPPARLGVVEVRPVWELKHS